LTSPERDDEYGKDGYSNCCVECAEDGKVGKHKYFSEAVLKP